MFHDRFLRLRVRTAYVRIGYIVKNITDKDHKVLQYTKMFSLDDFEMKIKIK